MSRRIVAAVVVAEAALFAGQAEAITTYTGERSLACTSGCTGMGDMTLSGIFTVDQLGMIDVSNIVDYEITINSPRYLPTDYTPANSDIETFDTVNITASDQELSFLFDGMGSEGFLVLRRDSDSRSVWLLDGGQFGSAPFFFDESMRNGPESAVDFGFLGRDQDSGPFAVTFDVVPVPAALPLMATGLFGLGWLARRRLRPDQPVDDQRTAR